MTSTLSCVTGSPATSNEITAVVNASLPASVSIAASPSGAICAGTSVTFTATPTNGGTPTYQWLKGGTAIPGETNPTYITTTLANGDVISVRMTSTLSCVTGSPATSNEITAVVNASLPASVSIAASPAGAICAGTSVTFTATPTNGGTPTYQWRKGGAPIPGETGPTYTSNALVNGDVITVVMTSSLTCVTGSPATSDAITMVINACGEPITLNISVTDIHCSGLEPGAINLTVTGGIAPYTYLWSNGATTEDLTNLTVAGTYTVTVTDSNGAKAETSATVKIINSPDAVIMTPAYTNPVCGDFMTNVLSAAPVGQDNVTYKWTVTNNGWSINGPDDRREVRFIASTGEATFTLKITDRYGCEDVATFVMNGCNPENYCTYTKAFYGKKNGKACDPDGNPVSPKEIMLNAFGSAGSINFGAQPGDNGFKFVLRINEVQSNFIFDMLPGGGKPDALEGNANSDPEKRTGWKYVPISTSKGNFGQIKNNLLVQTMTLFFNLSNDPGLGQVRITGKFLGTVDAWDCGSVFAESSTPRFTEIPSDVLKYLKMNNSITDLYNLANLVLSGVRTSPSVSPSEINAALDAINSAFDGCRILIGFYDQPVFHSGIPGVKADDQENADKQFVGKTGKFDFSDVSLRIYPNPFAKAVKFEVVMHSGAQVRIEIFSHSGTLLNVILNEKLDQGDVRTVVFDGSKYPNSAFIYRLTTRSTNLNGSIMKAH